MSYLDFHMKTFGWYYRWRTRYDTLKKMQVRTRSEILQKKKEFEHKYCLCEKQNSAEKGKYINYMEILKWVLREL